MPGLCHGHEKTRGSYREMVAAPLDGGRITGLLDFLDQVDHSGEMVTVTIHEDTRRVGAQGIALTFTLVAAQELAVKHLGPRES